MSDVSMRTAEDASLRARLSVGEFFQKFMQQWNNPMIRMGEAATKQTLLDEWDQVPPEGHAQLQAANPQAYARAQARVNTLKQKQNQAGG